MKLRLFLMWKDMGKCENHYHISELTLDNSVNNQNFLWRYTSIL